jgi:lipoyl(octanoyl) transferase
VPLIKHLGLVPYEPTWRAMQRFTDERGPSTADEIWLVEHPPTFTLGLNASREHLLSPGDIPIVQIDRGGQVTYHGPGQLVIYPLIDLRRHGLGVRQLVVALENAIIGYVAGLGVAASGSREAPGVYVEGAKLASVGLRIRRGASYHGAALNVSLDMEPFERINVCGFRGLAVTRLTDLCSVSSVREAADGLVPHLLEQLGFTPNDADAPSHGAIDPRDDGATNIGYGALNRGDGGATNPGHGAVNAGHSAINTDLQAVNSR